ncbi:MULTISPECIES: hypothetical protein [Nocardiopsidaceae]|uniref:RanBP2-type domain-containing protein n=2 Tax=Nocardiopsidaceae TaxID=83676 RepID=A0ABY6YSA7_9ACTN|nr:MULTISPECIES: hypothetical protein [Nocardiopsaceae]MEE2044428.1 hypothetical protein [Nocardiopsis tropica]MEE2050539.1 hypothetical protein [Nocardiopsis umidischolae]WAE75153.1 hypothetical protein OUQ99_08755 [Streptomonospora nanhaiensis]
MPMYLVLKRAVATFRISGTVWDWDCRLCGSSNSDGDHSCWSCGGRKP